MKTSLYAAVAACALAFASSAGASILVPPQSPTAPDVFASIPTGSIVASLLGQSFVSDLGAADFSGVYSTEVIQGANVFGANDLTFVYQFNNATTSGQDINRVTASDFGGFQTDVGYVTGTGDIPDSVDRTSSNPVGFNFATGVLPGTTSSVLIIETDATEFVPGHFSLIDDGVSLNPAFAPGVPEPKTWAMMIAGLAFLGFAARRRKRSINAFGI